ncbi:MAG: hypothetical protein M0Z51_11035 [Propionibacterium sp.]|nr:hypothetical protein [Propionibacterium sp.]
MSRLASIVTVLADLTALAAAVLVILAIDKPFGSERRRTRDAAVLCTAAFMVLTLCSVALWVAAWVYR